MLDRCETRDSGADHACGSGLDDHHDPTQPRTNSWCKKCALSEFDRRICGDIFSCGTCNVGQFHLGREKTTTWIGVNIGWGFAIMFCVMATANLSESFDQYDNGIRAVAGPTGTAGVFCSYPAPYLNMFSPYLDQVIGTGILAFFLCVVIDEKNKVPKVWHPMIFGFLVMMIGTAFGMNLGYPINPAREGEVVVGAHFAKIMIVRP
ncbi:hypothetical protein NECAME_15201 [Necator americanus]|uniref:Aquaporin-9 domain protein n=1 Tax=Necator americanus TaxID=51031 RepID=W2SIZ9_NECAM|nr:hypothetical protein NECAME_15201 [Necator americanus]ETN69634.1 hypothetical protein NECAME_15201 [Necator americanus]